MTDSPTSWSDNEDLQSTSHFTSKNPKLHYLSIVIGSVVIIGMVLIVMFTTPIENKLIAKFESNPEGASVIIDGSERGRTPITLRVKPGASELTLKKPGFSILKTQINVDKDGVFFTYNLVLQTQGLSITSNPENARVYFDGHFEGYTPFAFRKDLSGIHRIKVSLQGYSELEKEVDFDLGEGVFFNLEKKNYSIIVDTIPPGAELYIEEKHVGTTPWKSILPSGEYEIRLAKEGQRMIKRDIVITSDVELRYSFQTKDIIIEAKNGSDTITGGLIYVCIVKSGQIDKNIPPLLLGPSPWSGNSELISSYLTQEGKVPSFGLLVVKHPYYGASLSKIVLDENGQVKEIEKLVLPGISSLDIIGQPIDRIDFTTLLTEQPKPIQTIDNNPRFKIVSTNIFVDRDANPIKKTNLKGKPEFIIISPDEKYLAYLYGEKVNLIEIATGKEIIKAIYGQYFAFSPSSDKLFVQYQNEIITIKIKTSAVMRFRCGKQGVIIPINTTYLIIASKDTNLTLWDTTKNKLSSWQEVLGDSIWANTFVPINVIIRNIGGKDRVLLLGETFGLSCAIALEPKPTLLNIWMPEKSTTVELPSQ